MTSDFFKSEMVRGDLQEMSELQQFCMRSMVSFPVLSSEKKGEYFNALIALIEKQKVFYMRLILSDDPEAKDMVRSMKESVVLLGGEPREDILEMFNELVTRVNEMKDSLETD